MFMMMGIIYLKLEIIHSFLFFLVSIVVEFALLPNITATANPSEICIE